MSGASVRCSQSGPGNPASDSGKPSEHCHASRADSAPRSMQTVDCEEAWDLTYACVVEEDERGVFWAQVQLPTRRWWRGPYSDREHACVAAKAAYSVSQRCWEGCLRTLTYCSWPPQCGCTLSRCKSLLPCPKTSPAMFAVFASTLWLPSLSSALHHAAASDDTIPRHSSRCGSVRIHCGAPDQKGTLRTISVWPSMVVWQQTIPEMLPC